MTLPTIGNQETVQEQPPSTSKSSEESKGAYSGMRPTARLVRNKEDYIIENITWSEQLEGELIKNDLLDDQHGENDTVEKTKEVLNTIVQRRSAEGLRQLIYALDSYGNIPLANNLKAAMQETVPLSDHSTKVQRLTQRATYAERTAMKLHKEKQHLEVENAKLKQERELFRQRSVELHEKLQDEETKAKNQETVSNVTMGRLQKERDRLQIVKLQRERGIEHWQQHDQEQRGVISHLAERMDEMAMIIKAQQAESQNQGPKKGNKPRDIIDIQMPAGKSDKSLSKTSALPSIKTQVGSSDSKNQTLPANFGSVKRETPIHAKNSVSLNRTLPPDISALPASTPIVFSKNNKTLSPRYCKGEPTRSPRSDFAKLEPLPSIQNNDHGNDVVGEDNTDELDGPISSILSCKMAECKIGPEGGEIDLHNVKLHVPPKALLAPVTISVTEVDNKARRQREFNKAGLKTYLEAGTQLLLQPHGLKFERPVYIELKDANKGINDNVLVFHKDVEPYTDLPWTDITTQASPKLRRNDVVFEVKSFSIVETIRVICPLAIGVATGMALGLKIQALSLFNKKYSACDIFVYHRQRDSYMTVKCYNQRDDANNNVPQESLGPEYKLVGMSSTVVPVCDREILHFYYNTGPKLAGAFPYDFEKCHSKSQTFHVPLGGKQKSCIIPHTMWIKRRIPNVSSEEEICELPLRGTLVPIDIKDNNALENPLERMLRENRVQLVKSLDLSNTTVLSYLIQDSIISDGEKEYILSEATTHARNTKLIEVLQKKDPETTPQALLKALNEEYEFLMKPMEQGYYKALSEHGMKIPAGYDTVDGQLLAK